MASLAKVALQLPAAYELLRWVGVQRRRYRRLRLARKAGLLGAGLALGGGVAVLLAPRSGSETRRRLRDRAEQVRDYVTSEAAQGEASPSQTRDADAVGSTGLAQRSSSTPR